MKSQFRKKIVDYRIPVRFLINRNRLVSLRVAYNRNIRNLYNFHSISKRENATSSSSNTNSSNSKSNSNKRKEIVYENELNFARSYPKEFYIILKKLNLHIYSKIRFEMKFKTSIYNFIREFLDENKDKSWRENYYEDIMRHSVTFGRKIIPVKKKF